MVLHQTPLIINLRKKLMDHVLSLEYCVILRKSNDFFEKFQAVEVIQIVDRHQMRSVVTFQARLCFVN